MVKETDSTTSKHYIIRLALSKNSCVLELNQSQHIPTVIHFLAANHVNMLRNSRLEQQTNSKQPTPILTLILDEGIC